MHNNQPVVLATTYFLGVHEAHIFNFLSKATEHSRSLLTIFVFFCDNANILTDLSEPIASSLDQITSCCPNTNMPSRPPVIVVSYTSRDSVNTVSPCLTCTLQKQITSTGLMRMKISLFLRLSIQVKTFKWSATDFCCHSVSQWHFKWKIQVWSFYHVPSKIYCITDTMCKRATFLLTQQSYK